MTASPHRFVAFDPDGTIHTFVTLASVGRYAQGRRLTHLTVWELDPVRLEPVALSLRRVDPYWRLVDPATGMVRASADATGVTDPRVLATIDFFEPMDSEAAVEPRPIPPALWECAAFAPTSDTEARLHPLGYHEPGLLGRRWCFEYCAEVIAETAKGLTDAEFACYLTCIRIRAVMRVNAPDLDEATLAGNWDLAVYNAGPVYSAIVSRVELGVVDNQ